MPKKIDPKFEDIKEDVYNTATELLNKFFAKKTEYDESQAQDWAKEICESLIKKIGQTATFEGFKFIVNCSVLEHDDALHFESSSLWNVATDGTVNVDFENDEIYAFVTIYGVLN